MNQTDSSSAPATHHTADQQTVNPSASLRIYPPPPTSEAGLQALKALLRGRDPLASLEALHSVMGDVFRLNFPGFNPVFLIGPEANHFVTIEARHDLRWRSESDPVTKLLRQGLLVIDGEQHDSLRRQMNPSLHKARLPGYLSIMVNRTDQIASGWRDGSKLLMLDELRRIALVILFETLFSVDLSSDVDQLWQPVLRALKFISPGPWMFWPGIPRPGYRRSIQELDHYLLRVIARRREQGGPSGDMLGSLLTVPGIRNDVIRDQLATMLIAGHDTGTALMAWTLFLLCIHPEEMSKVREELDTLLGSSPPSAEQLPRLNRLDRVIHEALRLYPPVHLGSRIAAKDLNFQGYRIPAGTRVVYSIYLTHRMARYWPDPERFNPDRFLPDQMRDRLPYTYLPFGGGPRNCIGMAFAQVETKVVLARLLQTFHFQLKSNQIRARMGATLEPHPGVPVQVFHRHSSAKQVQL